MLGRLEFSREVEHGWARLKPGVDLSALGIVQRLLWVSRLLNQLLERSAVAGGLKHRGDYEVLMVLRRSEPEHPTPAEISSQLLTSASGMTTKLDRLEDLGLINRLDAPDDRRIVHIALTERGRSITDEAFMITLSFYNNLLVPLDASDREDLDDHLHKVLQRLDQLAATREPWDQP